MASRLLPRFQLPRRFSSSTTLPPLLWKPTDPCPTTTLHLLSWGRGSSGQLGGGVEEIRFYPTPLASLHLPVDFRVSPISGCLSHPTTLGPTLEVGVSCGLFHSSLLVDGRFWIWGKGDGGRLGLGHENSAFVPTLNPNIDGVRMVALGGLHSTALTCDGEIFTWGYGGFGALGHSVYHRELLPRLVKGPWSGKISHLATSGTHTAAVSCTGELYTWGRDEGDGRLGLGGGGGPANSNFELGRGDRVSDWRPKPVPSLQDVHIVQVASGGFHSLALTDEGKVLSWGHGGHGQLGHDSIQSQKVPLVVEALAEERVVYIACEGSSSAAITDKGKLYMWGNSRDCQLGVPGLPDVQPSPVEVKFLMEEEELGPHHVLSVVIGASHSMCLVRRSTM